MANPQWPVQVDEQTDASELAVSPVLRQLANQWPPMGQEIIAVVGGECTSRRKWKWDSQNVEVE